jgi:hypothetical protein
MKNLILNLGTYFKITSLCLSSHAIHIYKIQNADDFFCYKYDDAEQIGGDVLKIYARFEFFLHNKLMEKKLFFPDF